MNRFPLLLILAAACSGSSTQTEPRFVAVHNALSAMGMAQTGPISEGSLPEGAEARVEVELRAGDCYTFVALGSDSVDDLDIQVLDETGEEIGRDVTHDRQAAARACAARSGVHTAVVTMTEGRGGYLVSSWSGAPSGGGISGRIVPGGTGGGSCAETLALEFGQPQSGDTTGAINQVEAPCASGNAPERIYRLEVEERAQVSVTVQSTFDGALFITRECGQVASTLACNDDALPNDTSQSRIDTTLEPGTYYVVVDGYGDAAGAYQIEASMTRLRPLAEVCGDAATLSVGQPASGSTQGAADYFQATCADGARMPDRVYRLNVPQRSRMRLRQQTDHDGALYVRSTCADPTTELACNDDFRDTQGSLVTAIVDAGTYYVVADGFGSGGQVATGNYTLAAELAPEQGGGAQADDCGSAVPLEPGDQSIDTFEAVDDLAGSCGGQGAADIVRTLVVRARSRVVVRVRDSEFDGVVYVRRTCANGDTEVACVEVPISAPRTREAAFDQVLDPGTYSVVFDGKRPDSFGAAQVSLEVRDLVAMQRTCQQAPLLRSGRTINGTTAGESDDFQASCAEGARSGDQVYRLRVARRSAVRIDLTTDYDGALHLRRDCADLSTEVACNDDIDQNNRASRIEQTLDPGMYYVVVDGFSQGSEGTFSLQVDVSRP